MTTRLLQAAQTIGLATSGMLGARLGERLGIQTSWMTLLRWMMALPTAPAGPVAQLGIDDFSFRRGRRFGPILVDMQSHQTIDLLPDRKVEPAAAWMAAPPEIELVSRDRAGDYASAAAAGAPQAVQCADRVHLLHTLGKAIEGMLARHLAAHRRSIAQQSWVTPLAETPPQRPLKLSPTGANLQQAKREERLARYQQVITLHQQGLSQTAIADRGGIGHATVSRWLAHGAFPEQRPRPPKTGLDAHLSFVRQRWAAGCHHLAQVDRELVARGYSQS